MAEDSDPRVDIGVCLFLIVICCAVLVQAAKLPPGSFEPLGSAPIPQATAGLIIGLCILVIGRAALVMWRGEASAAAPPYPPRRLDAVALIGLTVVYVLLMAQRVAGFAPITALFLFVAIGFLTRFAPRSLVIAALTGVIMGWGCQYVFTQVFVVDLPAG